MRIVIDLQACQNGSRHRGIGRYAMAMTKALLRLDRGHDFRILLSDAFPDTVLDVRRTLEGLIPQAHIVVFSVLSRTSLTDPANAWRTRAAEMLRAQFIDRLEPDLLFVPSLFEGYWDRTVVSVEPAPYPVAVTLYDLIPLQYLAQHLPSDPDRAAYFLKLSHIRRADLIVPISHFVGDEAVTRLGIAPERIVVTPLGVDDVFRPPADGAIDRPALLQRYGIARPFVLNTSPLEFRKNIGGLIAGYAAMRADIRDAHQLVIVGRMTAEGHAHVTRLAAAAGLAGDAVVLAGYVPDEDLAALYTLCDLFCFPSLSEGFGLPVLEAMACGAPVVGSSTTSIPEVIERDDLLFDPMDAGAMGRVMERVLGNHELQAELRDFSLTRAAAFDWASAAAMAMTAFERLHAERADRPATVASHDIAPDIRPRLAFVASTMAVQHSVTGAGITLATALADRYDVVLVCPDGQTEDIWARSVFEIRDFDWFEAHAGGFDRIVYGAEPWAGTRFTALMADHPGLLIVQEPMGAFVDADRMGRHMPAPLRQAIVASRGHAGLLEALDGRISPAEAEALLFEQLQDAAPTMLAGSVQACAATGDRTFAMPAMVRSANAAAQFRADHAIPESVPLIAGFAADEESAMRLIQAFGSSRAAQEADGHLVLHVAEGRPGPAGKGVHLLTALDSCYRGLASAADVSICVGTLPAGRIERIRGDAACCGQASAWIEADGDGDGDGDGLTAACDRRRRHVPPGSPYSADMVPLPLPLSREAIGRLLATLEAPLPDSVAVARRRLAARLPVTVRTIGPDGDDLAAVAIALARNEAQDRPAAIFCDVSALTASDESRPIDPPSRSMLRAILRQGGRDLHAVRIDAGGVVIVDPFVQALTGLETPGLADTPVTIRPGDRIIGFDTLGAFPPSTLPALRDAVERGAAISYIIAGKLPAERGDLLPGIVDLALAWADALPGGIASRLAPPDALVSRRSGCDCGTATATIGQLIAAAIPVNILAADGQPVCPEATTEDHGPSGLPIPIALPEAVDRLFAALT